MNDNYAAVLSFINDNVRTLILSKNIYGLKVLTRIAQECNDPFVIKED